MKQKEKKERKLTKAELRRKARFEALAADMEERGWTAHNLTIGVVKANILAFFVMFPFALAVAIWYLMVNGSLNEPSLTDMLVLLIALLAVHKGIHGLVWGCTPPVASAPSSSVSFGRRCPPTAPAPSP